MAQIGSNHSQAKLTEDDVSMILRYLKEGKKQMHIARDFGVSQPAIWKIKENISWKHVLREGGNK